MLDLGDGEFAHQENFEAAQTEEQKQAREEGFSALEDIDRLIEVRAMRPQLFSNSERVDILSTEFKFADLMKSLHMNASPEKTGQQPKPSQD